MDILNLNKRATTLKNGKLSSLLKMDSQSAMIDYSQINELFSCTRNTLEGTSAIIDLINLSRNNDISNYLQEHGKDAAAFLSSFYAHAKLLYKDPGLDSLVTFIVFVCDNLQRNDLVEKVQDFIVKAFRDLINLIEPLFNLPHLGFESQSYSKLNYIAFLLKEAKYGVTLISGIDDLINDELWNHILDFVHKVSYFFTSILFDIEWSKMSTCNSVELFNFIKDKWNAGADIITIVIKSVQYIVSNWDKLLTGEATIFFGRDEIRKFESRYTDIIGNKEYALEGNEQALQNTLDLSLQLYELKVKELIDDVNRLLTTRSASQKAALVNYRINLIKLDNELSDIQRHQITRPEPFAIALIGESGQGKSTISPILARTIIESCGYKYDSKLVQAGSVTDKFDSTEMPTHLVLTYDDVNNGTKEAPNMDKIINVVNSQPRPFIKASVEQKGKLFPHNIGAIISSNMFGFGAEKGSNCSESILRRMDLHIKVEANDDRAKSGEFIDPAKCDSLVGIEKVSIWKFTVYKFLRYEENKLHEKSEDDTENLDSPADKLKDGEHYLHGNYLYEELKIFDGQKGDSIYDLCNWIKFKCVSKIESGKKRVISNNFNEPLCKGCCHPKSLCRQKPSCTVEMSSQGFSDSLLFKKLREHCDMEAMISNLYQSNKKKELVFALMKYVKIQYELATSFTLNSGDDLARSMCGKFSTCQQNWLHLLILTKYFYFIFFGSTLLTIYFAGFKPTIFVGGVLLVSVSFMCCLIRTVRLNEINSTSFLLSIPVPSQDSCSGITLKVVAALAFAKMCHSIWHITRHTIFSSQDANAYDTFSMTERYNAHKSVPQQEVARTISSSDFERRIMKNVGEVKFIGTKSGDISIAKTFCVASNLWAVTAHLIPLDDTFIVEINYPKENKSGNLSARETLSHNNVYRYTGKDLAIIHVASASPRKELLQYLPVKGKYPLTTNGKFLSSDKHLSVNIKQPEMIKTSKIGSQEAIIYHINGGITADGDCGSPIISKTYNQIVGIHMAGVPNQSTAAMQQLFLEDVEQAKEFFESQGFVPHSRGELNHRNNTILITGDTIIEQEELSQDDFNFDIVGINNDLCNKARKHYKKHKFYDSVVEQFGEPENIPPQKINSNLHKLKMMTRVGAPNQDFVKDEVIDAVDDYMSTINDFIDNMSFDDRAEIRRALTDDEVLNGIPNDVIKGLNNGTSVGYPYKGKKIKYMEASDIDPNVPIMPRKLIEYDCVNMQDEANDLARKYESIAGLSTFKGSMKANELLPKHKFKARVFAGCNFPFLLVVRKYLSVITRMMGQNKRMFEMGKGLDMNGPDADSLYKYLAMYSKDKIVALDYSAFDQTMSAQVSSQASNIILRIMKRLGCPLDQIAIAKGCLTDINYPTTTIGNAFVRLANSNPSGQPLTTEVNGIVNSLYLRILFFRIYPKLKGKVNYRDCIRTMTYGDDNISAVKEGYLDFNGERIVEEGKKVGLIITMADKDADIVKFTELMGASDFLKRKFRYCAELDRVLAPLAKSSITKSFYFRGRESCGTDEDLFEQNVDRALRDASHHGEEYYNDIRVKLQNIANLNNMNAIPFPSYEYQLDYIKYGRDKDDVSIIHMESQSLSVKAMYFAVESLTFTKSLLSLVMTCCCVVTVFIGGLNCDLNVIFSSFRFFNYLTALHSPAMLFSQVTDLLSKSSYIGAGRANEIGESTKTYIDKLKYYQNIMRWRLNFSCVFPTLFWTPQFLRYSNQLGSLISDLTLSEDRDIIRKQPFGIMLLGPPGSGKSFLAHTLIRNIYSHRGHINTSEIVTLNETDEFQSEFRTHHKVVILDDIANEAAPETSAYAAPKNPFRKIIDFINNITKVALNPTLEAKGRVLIKPELVVCTSNMDSRHFSGNTLAQYRLPAPSYILSKATIAPMSIIRRLNWIKVLKNDDWIKTKSGFDPLRYKLFIASNIADSDCINIQWDEISYEHLVSLMVYSFHEFEKEQETMAGYVEEIYNSKDIYPLVNKEELINYRCILRSNNKARSDALGSVDIIDYVKPLIPDTSLEQICQSIEDDDLSTSDGDDIDCFVANPKDQKLTFEQKIAMHSRHANNNKPNDWRYESLELRFESRECFPLGEHSYLKKHYTCDQISEIFISPGLQVSTSFYGNKIYRFNVSGMLCHMDGEIYDYCEHKHHRIIPPRGDIIAYRKGDSYYLLRDFIYFELNLHFNAWILDESNSKFESQSKAIKSKQASLLDNYINKQVSPKIKLDFNFQHILGLLIYPPAGDYLLPNLCGDSPSFIEEQIIDQAISEFRKLGWSMIARECIFEGHSVDLLMYIPGVRPVLGLVEAKASNMSETFNQLLVRLSSIPCTRTLGFAYTPAHIMCLGKLEKFNDETEVLSSLVKISDISSDVLTPSGDNNTLSSRSCGQHGGLLVRNRSYCQIFDDNDDVEQ